MQRLEYCVNYNLRYRLFRKFRKHRSVMNYYISMRLTTYKFIVRKCAHAPLISLTIPLINQNLDYNMQKQEIC